MHPIENIMQTSMEQIKRQILYLCNNNIVIVY